MNKRNIWIGVGLIVMLLLIGGGLAYFRVQAWMDLPDLAISYQTVQTPRPEGSVCAGEGAEGPRIAKEILNLETDVIYVGGGPDAMPDEVWADYSFRLPLLKNSTRELLFDESCFFRSPGVDPACEGDACFTVEEIVGYSWLALTVVEGQSCYPDPSGCRADVVDPGYLSITTIAKCHEITYSGPTIYVLSDGLGNEAVMHATATGTPDIDHVALPEGWTLEARQIDAPFTILPFGGGTECHYNIIRDNLVQSYHQFAYAEERYP